MANKTFEDLYDLILPYLPGAEQAIVDLQICKALREFFKRTTVWRETFAFNTTIGADTYSLTPTAGEVSSTLLVKAQGNKIDPAPEQLRDPNAVPGPPRGWYSLIPRLLVLYPVPDAIYPISLTAVITLPIDGSLRTYPEEVHSEHAEAIANGVMGAMMAMPGKPWSKMDSAQVYGGAFGKAIRDTRGKLRDGGQPNQSTFRAPCRFGV
jgi:hypothetical protein